MPDKPNQTDTQRKAGSKAEWKKRAVHPGITLPSGMVVDLKLPDLPQLAKAGDIPTELLDASEQLVETANAGNTEKMQAEVLINIAGFMEFLIPKMVVKPEITPEDVKEIPAEDQMLLVEFARRERDVDSVGHQLGGLETLAEWRTFRYGEFAA